MNSTIEGTTRLKDGNNSSPMEGADTGIILVNYESGLETSRSS